MQRSNTLIFADRFVRSLQERLGLWFEINDIDWNSTSISESHLTDGESFVLVSIGKGPRKYDSAWKVGLSECETLWVSVANREDSRKKFNFSAFVDEIIAFASSGSFQPDSVLVASLSVACFGTRPLTGVVESFSKVFGKDMVQSMPQYGGLLNDDSEVTIEIDPTGCWLQVWFRVAISVVEANRMLERLVGSPIALKLGTQQSFQVTGKLSACSVARISVISRGNG